MIIKQLIREAGRVIERLTETYPCDSCNVEVCYRRCYKITLWAEKAKEKLAEYENTEEEGRLVVPTYKVGDTVYVIAPQNLNCIRKYDCDEYDPEEYLITWCENFCLYGYKGTGVIESIVDAIVILKDRIIYRTDKCGYRQKIYSAKEEAEKALEEMKRT